MLDFIRKRPDWLKTCLVDFLALMYAATTSVLTFSLFSHVLLELSLSFWIIYPVLGAVFVCNFIMGFKKLANIFFSKTGNESQQQHKEPVVSRAIYIVLGMLMLYVSGFVGIEYLGAWMALGLPWSLSVSFAILGGICYYNLVLQLSIEGFQKIKETFSQESKSDTSSYIDKIAQILLIVSVLGLIVTVVVLPVFSIWVPSWLLTTLGVLNLGGLAWIAWKKFNGSSESKDKKWYSLDFITFYLDQVIDFAFLSIHALSESYVSGHGCYQTFGSHVVTTCTVLINFVIEWSSDASGVLSGKEDKQDDTDQHTHGGSGYTQVIVRYARKNPLATISIIAFSTFAYWLLLGMQVPIIAVVLGTILAGYIQKQVCGLIEDINKSNPVDKNYLVESLIVFVMVVTLGYLLAPMNLLQMIFIGICSAQLSIWCSSLKDENKELWLGLFALLALVMGVSLVHASLMSPLMAMMVGMVVFSLMVSVYNHFSHEDKKAESDQAKHPNSMISMMALIAALGLSLNGAVEFQAVLQSPFYMVLVMGFISCFIEFSVYSNNISSFKSDWLSNPQASVDFDNQEATVKSKNKTQELRNSASQPSHFSSS